MESRSQQHYDPQQLQSQQPSLGLLRFRSAPNSLFGNFMDGGIDKARSESEILVPRFMNSGSDKSSSPASPTVASSQSTFSGLPPHYPRQGAALSSSTMDTDSSSYDFLPIDHQGHGKPIGSNLSRQSSSPAGFFGYSNMKVVGNYGGLNGGSGDVSPLSNSTKNPITFSSRLPSSLGMLSQIPESEAEAIGGAAPDDDGKLKCGNFDPQFYNSSLSYGSWNGSPHLMDTFSGMKRELDSDHNGCVGDSVPRLSHHLSLPKTSSEMAAVEKFLQFQDSVPCKVRAKRGCATHPRSIAERVRRTRISERMRKLQDLVPNMDKQTNTADMLDLAVDYIKDLQRQFKLLSDSRAKCRCSDVQKPVDSLFI